MPEGSVVFSKIAATATDNAWSQAYSAGKLFTVLSLKNTGESKEDKEDSLKLLGKSILDSLETEFFSLEEKNLESVKNAITEASKLIKEGLEFSFVTTVVSGNVLYSYIVGKGKIFIKRGDKFGYVLESENESKEIASASGFLQNSDLIILATEDFTKSISKDQIVSSLESPTPSEIAENLAPTIHESEEGGSAAIIMSYAEDTSPATAVEEEKETISPVDISQPEPKEEEKQYSDYLKGESQKKNPLAFLGIIFIPVKKLFSMPKSGLAHSKKIYLTIAVLILVVLVASIFLGIKRQNDAKVAAAFEAVYPAAQKKFDEGESLKDLNQSLAMDSFNSAKQILEENKSKFPSDSTQEKQIDDLLAKVNSELTTTNTPKTLDKSKITIEAENGSGAEGAAGKLSDSLKELGYNVAGTSNADNYNYSGVTIQVKASAKDYLEGLKSDLSKSYTISNATSDLSSGSPTDAVVIIGK